MVKKLGIHKGIHRSVTLLVFFNITAIIILRLVQLGIDLDLNMLPRPYLNHG